MVLTTRILRFKWLLLFHNFAYTHFNNEPIARPMSLIDVSATISLDHLQVKAIGGGFILIKGNVTLY